MYRILYLLPKNYISTFIGALAAIPVPQFLRRFVIGLFAELAGVRVEDASKTLPEYGSVAEFFTRDLKGGIRPIANGIVSPVDGTLRSSNPIASLQQEQIKGQYYSLEALLGSTAGASSFAGGTFISLYLAPPDYHHVHSPCDAQILGITYIPGSLWPVNDWALTHIRGLFARNERVVIDMQNAAGRFAVVMVGAMNVGKMSLTFHPLVTNVKRLAPFSKRFEEPISIQSGDRLGTFHLGSTVLLLFDAASSRSIAEVREPGKIRFGESLARS